MQPFEAIVAEHGPVVMRVCRALLGPVEADDAWSETFLAALRAYPELRPDSNLRGWLVTIAHRKAIDQIRDEYDLVLIDCPPSLGVLTVNGLTAAQKSALTLSTNAPAVPMH